MISTNDEDINCVNTAVACEFMATLTTNYYRHDDAVTVDASIQA